MSARRTAMVVVMLVLLGMLPSTPAASDVADDPGTLQRFTYSSRLGTNPYLVYTPRTYHHPPRARVSARPVPLYVMVHGCNTTALEQANANELHALAERQRFVVMYPDNTNEVEGFEGWVGTHPLACWRWYSAIDNLRESGDPAQIAGITREVIANWNIDEDRVYVAGMSSGAMITSVLGATYPDLYTAIGIVAGCGYLDTACVAPPLNGHQPLIETRARAARQMMGDHARVVPVIEMHGDMDTTVPPGGGADAVRQWLMTNNLVASGSPTSPFPLTPSATTSGSRKGGYSWEVDAYTGDKGCLVAEHWRIADMGHYWPGGTDDPEWAEWTDWKGPSGARATWNFFSRFTRSGRTKPC